MGAQEATNSIEILLVDDSPTVIKGIRSYLAEGKTDSYTVVEAASLAQALDALKEQSFDIVMLDITLPDSSDMDTITSVRAKAPDTAIVVLTGSGETRTAKEALKHGCQDFLIKDSFDANLMRHVIRYAVERSRMEVKQRKNEQRFQDYAEAGADWFWEMDLNLSFRYLSDEFEDVMGLDKNAFLGKSLALIGPVQKTGPDWGKNLKRLHDHQSFRNFECAFEGNEGDLQWLQLNGRPIFDDDGQFQGYRGTCADITLEKYDEWQLRHSKEVVDGILSTSLDGFLVLKSIRDVYDKIGDFSFTHINRKAEEILGRSRMDLLGKLFRLEMPHMVSQGVFDRAVKTATTGASFDVEQFYNEKGMQGWLRVIGVKLGDGVVISLSEISARKEAEREQRMATALFRTSAEAMLVTDANNRIVTANPAFSKITGYPIDEVVGKDPNILSSGRHPKEFYKNLWQTLTRDGHWFGEFWNRRKDGEVYVERATISVIRNDKGVVENYVAVLKETTEEKERELKLYQQANYDALTKLPNRSLLADRIAHVIPMAKREKRTLAVLFLDLDGFKPINDTYGHLAGDQVLQEVAERFTACVREGDTVARIGGDEFVILCEELSDQQAAELVARHLLSCLEAPFIYEDATLQVGASIGISLFPEHGGDARTLMGKADKAMYAAKAAGKGDYRLYEDP